MPQVAQAASACGTWHITKEIHSAVADRAGSAEQQMGQGAQDREHKTERQIGHGEEKGSGIWGG